MMKHLKCTGNKMSLPNESETTQKHDQTFICWDCDKEKPITDYCPICESCKECCKAGGCTDARHFS